MWLRALRGSRVQKLQRHTFYAKLFWHKVWAGDMGRKRGSSLQLRNNNAKSYPCGYEKWVNQRFYPHSILEGSREMDRSQL
jgi:hypothetical protein